MLPNYESEYEAIRVVASRLGIGTPESLRKWIRQAQVDAGQRPGVTSAGSAEIKRLRRENAERRRANGTAARIGHRWSQAASAT